MNGTIVAGLLLSAALAAAASSDGLTLALYSNTVLTGEPMSTHTLQAADLAPLAIPADRPLSAELTGTFSPPESPAGGWSWRCRFSNVELAFVTVDGHAVCSGAARYNNTASGMMDDTGFRLLTKQSQLVVRAQIYHLRPSVGTVQASIELCAQSGCTPLPGLSARLPPAELERRKLQAGMARGWGSWLHRDILSVVLLPDSAVLTVQICQISTGVCLREAQIDQNGGSPGQSREQHRFVRVGRHAMDHSYSQVYVRYSQEHQQMPGVNVSIEYATNGPSGRGLDLTVTPVAEPGINASDFAVAFAGSFGWDRVGEAMAEAATLQLTGYGLAKVNLQSTAPNIQVAGVLPPGGLAGASCSSHTDCASGHCSCNHCSCHQCSSQPPGCAPGSDSGVSSGCGLCTNPVAELPHVGALLSNGPVGFTTHTDLQATPPALAGVLERISAMRKAEEEHDTRFGLNETAELTEALTAALSWRNVWTGGAEDGPVLPMTYGFSWITPTKHGASADWKYVLFCWDNIFASFTAGVLGYRDAAYSNLIQIVKAKSRDGFVPNWAAGGSKNTVAEPAVAGRVLLELYQRFGEIWIVELLFDDLLDWNKWQWSNRRTVSAHDCCTEPGFITIGNDYTNCTGTSGNCPGGGESGLDQSPLWDCPGALPDGSGGNCSVFETKTGLGPNPSHVLQIGDTQSTSLFVHDAMCLAQLARLLRRTADERLLLDRALQMQAQLQKLWDPTRRFFADRFVLSGEFSTKLTPTAVYPLLAGGVTAEQAVATVGHLANSSELCVSADFAESSPALCYWGLPSVSRSDIAYMQPQSYIYWRGAAE